MGEIADDHINQMFDDGYFGNIGGYYRPRYHPPARERNRSVCKLCGSEDVHWRETDEGWRLHENERQHPGNRYVEHACPTSAEGFEDEPV